VQTRFHIRRKVITLLLCLLLSTVLWLLNDLNRLQTSSVQIPVKFTGLPYDMVTTNTLPSHMDATVEATGFNLLWRKFTREEKIVEIPLRLENGMVSPDQTFLFNINYYMDDITDALGSHVKIRRIFPDTFSIRFARKYSKKVPIVLSSDLNFEKEFYVSEAVILDPDSVVISGTKEKVTSVGAVSTRQLSLKKLRDTYQGNLELEGINGITYNIQEVGVTLPVEQFTEKELSVPVTATSVPAHYELNTIPNIIKLKVLVPISDFNLIDATLFQVSAEFPSNSQSVNQIILKVTRKPEFVKILSVTPSSVEYKIKQKTR
jgi:hypothetical protein